MKEIKKFLKKITLGHKSDSASFVRHLRSLGMRIGEGTCFFSPTHVLVDETRPWLIEIGRDVQIAHGVVILTHGYDWAVVKNLHGEIQGSAGKVTIGDNVFIGVNAVILKGVNIGSNVIIGAGSVVNRDIPPNTVAAGNPARVVMTLEEYRQRRWAAQEREARELVREYRKVYGKDPAQAELSEFFWLFSDDPEGLPECWREKQALCGSGELSNRALAKNEKRYESMADFLESC